MNSLSNERQKEGQAFNQFTTAIKKQRLTVDSQPVANAIASYLNNGTIKLADNLSKSLESSLERSVKNVEDNIQNNLKLLREADNDLKNDLEAVEQEKTELNNKIEQEKKIHKQIQKLMIPFGMLILFAVGIFLWFKGLVSIPFVSEAYHVILSGTNKNRELIVIALMMILLTFIAPFWFFNWITRRTLCRVCGITKEDIEDDINEDDEPAWLRYCENHMSDFGAKIADFMAVYVLGSERRAKKRVAWRLISRELYR